MRDRGECVSCASYLAPGKHHPRTGKSYFVPCCMRPKLVNQHGVLAVSIARAAGQRCGPEAVYWRRRADE